MKFTPTEASRQAALADIRRKVRPQSIAAAGRRVVPLLQVRTDRADIEKLAIEKDLKFPDGVVRRRLSLGLQNLGDILGVAHKSPHRWVAIGDLPRPIAVAEKTGQFRYTVEEVVAYALIIRMTVERHQIEAGRKLFSIEFSPSGRLYKARNLLARQLMGVIDG